MSMKKALYPRFKEQDSSEIFCAMTFDSETSKAIDNWETPFYRLAEMAKKEDWDFEKEQYKVHNQNYPILMNYLNYTFLRLQDQGKVVYSEDNTRAVFNTGLQTPAEKDIYATFFANKKAIEYNAPEWTLYAFVDSYSGELSSFPSLPEVATYIQDASDLVFDVNLDIEVNTDHIVDHNEDRLPKSLQGNRRLAMTSIVGATNFLKQKVLRNYKVAIPHWYNGAIQLLLPLNITSDTEADLALVADKDKHRNIYRIKTALPMDKAYINARLICRPDKEWLNP